MRMLFRKKCAKATFSHESKTRTHRLSKLADVGDPWAPNNLLTPRQKKKHQLDPGGPSNRQEAPVPTN